MSSVVPELDVAVVNAPLRTLVSLSAAFLIPFGAGCLNRNVPSEHRDAVPGRDEIAHSQATCPATHASQPPALLESERSLGSLVGRVVAVEGTTENRKSGPYLIAEFRALPLRGLEDWPSDLIGSRVRVIGTLDRDPDYIVPPRGNGPMPQFTGKPGSVVRGQFFIRDVRWDDLGKPKP